MYFIGIMQEISAGFIKKIQFNFRVVICALYGSVLVCQNAYAFIADEQVVTRLQSAAEQIQHSVSCRIMRRKTYFLYFTRCRIS